MNEIKCPNCQKVFQVDESGYAAILKQVHDSEFDKEIERRKKDFEDNEKRSVELAVTKANADKDKQISSLKSELDQAKHQLEISNQEKKIEIANALHVKEKEVLDKNARILELEGQLKTQMSESSLKEKSIEDNYRNQLMAKDKEILEEVNTHLRSVRDTWKQVMALAK